MMNKHLLRQTPMSRRGALAALGIGAAGAALAACSSSTTAPSQTSRAVEYWLWDADQLPAYQACANAFEEATGIHVNITQIAWDDYLYEVMTLVTCTGTRVAGGWLRQAVWGRW